MHWLIQSTAATVKIGPFLDSTDGVTAETGLTISQADVRLSKNGANIAQKNEASACTHDELGYYDCDLDATDTGTLGRLLVAVAEAGALPVWHEFMVLPANTFDSLVSGSDYLQTDAIQVEGSDATDQINAACDTAFTDYDPPTKAELDSGLAALNDPTAAAIRTEIDSNSTQLAAIVADTNELQTDDVPGLIGALNDPTAAAIADAVWDEDVVAAHNTADTAGALLDDLGTPGDFKADVSGVATAANLATVDTVVDAIKAVTDNLPNSGALSDLATAANLATVDTVVDSILADTGTDGVAIATATAQAIADEVLKRGIDNVEDAADTLSLAAIVLAMLESSISGTTWTIKKSDGSTFTTKTVTTDSGADPVTAVT